MAICSLAGDAGLFGSTPVENLFIQEYMLRAPGEYVKVYLYGLMQCLYPGTAEVSLEKFAASMRMEVTDVKKALIYWRNKGLVKENDANYEFLNVRSAMFDNRIGLAQERIYEHAGLSNRLDTVARGRAFSAAEYELLYDLVDVYGFEEEAVVLLIENCINGFGKRFTTTRLESVIREWKKAGILTEQKAREHILGYTLRGSGANKILAAMGITHRTVSEDEHQLFIKWTEEWGFSLDAVREACRQMTGVQNPNFKYLDKRIQTLRERGLTSARKIREGEQTKSAFDQKVQKCMFRMGLSGMVTDTQRRYYQTWTESYGMSEEAILLVCDEVSSRGSASFKAAESLMTAYSRQNLRSSNDILQDQILSKKTKRILEAAGITRIPTEKEKMQADKWLSSMPMPVILLAAEHAADTKKPMGYLTRVMSDWQQKKIQTKDQAREELRIKSQPSAESTPSHIHYENERNYQTGELDDLLIDLSDGERRA